MTIRADVKANSASRSCSTSRLHGGRVIVSYPWRRFRGRVQGIGWALFQRNGATVGVLPETEPTLNWVRLAQRFPVRIVLEERDTDHPFRMGQTAVVTVRGAR